MMALRGYLIETYDNMGPAYTCRRLVEEAVAAGVDLRMIGSLDCRLCAGGNVINRREYLDNVDFVINRYKTGETAEAVNALARAGFNDWRKFSRYVNKYRQMIDLKSVGLGMPGWFLSTSACDFETIAAEVGVPFVMKGLESSMGREIFLIETPMQYADTVRRFPQPKEWLFEEYVAESRGRDLRLFVVGTEAVAAMCRRSDGDFRANVALGAGVSHVPVDDELRSIASRIGGVTGLDFAGIDLLYGNDGYVFCEINVMPGLEGIEKASGKNIAALMIDHIKRRMS